MFFFAFLIFPFYVDFLFQYTKENGQEGSGGGGGGGGRLERGQSKHKKRTGKGSIECLLHLTRNGFHWPGVF